MAHLSLKHPRTVLTSWATILRWLVRLELKLYLCADEMNGLVGSGLFDERARIKL